MSRFIRITQKNGDVIEVNTECVEQVGFRPKEETPTVYIFLVGSPAEDAFGVPFKTDDDALAFIEKNFVLFNA